MKVFISYASTDAKLAKQVADALKKAGFQTWDETQIFPGENWAEGLAKSLQESDAMVVLLTPASIRSSNIQHEIGYALGKQDYKDKVLSVIAASDEQLPLTEIPWILKKLRVIRIPNLGENEEGLRRITRTLEVVAQSH
ncbi:MAG: toll/interleukin-1 receptor domain-containing protein [Leptolyngbyaceae cyanobacterium RM2_2_4]|nr:toll/interleukin-1 receptor domain-containing protein [Leptolyngbyaceae cyanobacterium SM1_4_3]NJN56924.1 toll/interleukin-1 receptor domain-containing protein [Leptolyngbyaceae cyanobacterium SL_5_9]NJO49146.1 toll/interleukin-1 receptor domain-containing protein [Leptolyngbyaceae cyanobacterium RM2_2_4]NJO75951.1 toll/interleukin-1 receptor domain-containing protein [Leptolyngbyaceae cyanobacterium RM1_406_9]